MQYLSTYLREIILLTTGYFKLKITFGSLLGNGVVSWITGR